MEINIQTNLTTKYDTWESIGLKEELLKGIYGNGFEEPTPVQELTIYPAAILKKDLLAQANAGQGKTGCFVISTLQNIDQTLKQNQAIILQPTKEIAEQTFQIFKLIAKFMDVSIIKLIGGSLVKGAEEEIKRAQIIVGTPGKIVDLLSKKLINKDNTLHCLVLDEADKLLDKTFIEDIQKIFQSLNQNTQVMLFSATMDEPIKEIYKKGIFREDVQILLVEQKDVTLQKIVQQYYRVKNEKDKIQALLGFIQITNNEQCIIFANSKKQVENIKQQLEQLQLPLQCIHGEMMQFERDQIMDQFRKGFFRILIATDLLARGIDIQQISLVINFEVSQDPENYIHRIGRCGRLNKSGRVINIANDYDMQNLSNIQQKYQFKLTPFENI